MSKYHCILDASALLKKYHEETGSDLIRALFNHPDCAIHMLNVTIPEVTGAFVRWQLDEDIDSDTRNALKDVFIDDIKDYKVVVHNITDRNIIQTDDVWDKSVGIKPAKLRDIMDTIHCPKCGDSFERKIERRKQRVGPVDVLVLSACLALKASYGKVYLFSCDDHMLKVAAKKRITTCNPEASMQLPF